MASAGRMAWTERLAWIFIYTGLFAFVLGLATLGHQLPVAWSLIVGGVALAIAGAVLVWLRSRWRED
jgi:vacuolar-type H+-ATPase subunit I/STV1